MICSSCNTVYSASASELGSVETLAGLCESCGTQRQWLPFVKSFSSTAVGAVLGLELLVIVGLRAGWLATLIPVGTVLGISAVLYLFSMNSAVVRYSSEEDRKAETRGQRLAGAALGSFVGFAVSWAAFDLLTG